jgi:hypothetical protein
MVKVLLFLLLTGSVYAEEGTTTILPSSLEIIGKDKSEFFWREEVSTVSLTFPSIPSLPKRKIERAKEDVELPTKRPELPIILEERKEVFKKDAAIPSIMLGVGIRSQIISEFLYAKEKEGKSLSFTLFRQARDGFDWNEKKDFWQISNDSGRIVFGLGREKQRIVGKLTLEGEDIFLPYQEKLEKRRREGIDLKYNSQSFADLDIELFANKETKEAIADITNKGIGTKVSFDIGKARFHLQGEGERDRTVSSLILAMPKAKRRGVLFSEEFGIDSHKGKTSKTAPHLSLNLSYPFSETFTTKISAKAGLSTPSFADLYLNDPYSVVGKGISPESILQLSSECELYLKNLFICGGIFVKSTKDHIYYEQKEPGLYEPKNMEQTVIEFGAKSNLLWKIKENMELESSMSLVSFNKDIPYIPKAEANVSFEYKKRPFSLKPRVYFVNSEKIPSSTIFSILAEREEDKSLWFLKIDNLFNVSYLKREEYPGERLSILIGVKMVL